MLFKAAENGAESLQKARWRWGRFKSLKVRTRGRRMSLLILCWIMTSNRPGLNPSPIIYLPWINPLNSLNLDLQISSVEIMILLCKLNDVAQMKQVLLLLLFSDLPSVGSGVGLGGWEEAVQITTYPASQALARLLLSLPA